MNLYCFTQVQLPNNFNNPNVGFKLRANYRYGRHELSNYALVLTNKAYVFDIDAVGWIKQTYFVLFKNVILIIKFPFSSVDLFAPPSCTYQVNNRPDRCYLKAVMVLFEIAFFSFFDVH